MNRGAAAICPPGIPIGPGTEPDTQGKRILTVGRGIAAATLHIAVAARWKERGCLIQEAFTNRPTGHHLSANREA
jgi:hypothetical protein